MTHEEYRDEIYEIAKYLNADYKDEDERIDRLHELIDSHEYIIYTKNYLPLLQITENADYYLDEFGHNDATNCLYQGGLDRLHQVVCCWAMYADVMEVL